MRGVPRGGARARVPGGIVGLLARLARCVLVIALLAGAAACGGEPGPDRVTIMVPWSKAEFRAFYAVVKEFEADTGIRVDVEVTRALTQQLDAADAAGAPPDLAVLPSVGALYKYASGRVEHPLQPLDPGTTTEYLEPFRSLATVAGKVVAVPVKADVKSLIWQDPSADGDRGSGTRSAAKNPDDATWCLGLASGPVSGWPGADWIADFVLAGNRSSAGGTTTYLSWLTSRSQWEGTVYAWERWRTTVGGSADHAADKGYDEASRGMVDRPQTCSRAHGALSAMGFSPKLRPGTRYDFQTPDKGAGPLQVSADFVGRFTDGAAARAFLSYLSSPAAQRSWVNKPGGYALSASRQVREDDYTNHVQSRIAAMLRPDSGYALCFSAADAMQPDVSAAFYRAVLDFATQSQELDTLLEGLDAVQTSRGSSPVPKDRLCSRR